jgi:hypothetical protein
MSSETGSTSLAFLLMRVPVLALVLALTGMSSGVVASSYGSAIATAPTQKAALPFAAPFALFSVAAAAALTLSAVALCDERAL